MSETTNDQPYDLRAKLALARRESLVERLRGWCSHSDEYPRGLIEEAADEIVQLRAELAAERATTASLLRTLALIREAGGWQTQMLAELPDAAKAMREQHSHKRDNMIDAAGYAACVAEINGEDLSEVSEAVEETLETVAEIIERRRNFDAPIL